jgi:nucleoside 2-deoxyribosyltransferase
MPLLYGPLDNSEMNELVQPFPRTAFLMIHDNDRVAAVEATMQRIVREELASAGFDSKAASQVRRAGDFLAKIIRLIRGCGFGIAIFSDATPPSTLANIFFEVGYCLALGKPAYLVLAGAGAAPSDFVRSEWIEFEPQNEASFRRSLKETLAGVDEYGRFLEDIARSAEEAEEMNPELAYERFRRAYLVSQSDRALEGVRRILARLRAAKTDAAAAHLLRSYRRNLVDEIANFHRLCGPA